jgi:hypothetical protein
MEILGDTPGAYAAVAAWQALPGAPSPPTRVRSLEAGHKNRTIYRLEGLEADDTWVIAKLCRPATGGIERRIYETILPSVPVTAPRYFGSIEIDGAGLWLFLEDVGPERFSSEDREQRIAVARWLGVLHSRAVDVPAADELPDRGPRHYLERLREARRMIVDSLSNADIRPDDALVLRLVIELLDTIEADWASVEAFCGGMPWTVTHGDIRRKNVSVRRHAELGLWLLPIDWETAGWGVPAADLAPARGPVARPAVDLASYAEAVEWRWPYMDEASCRALAAVGALFRRLAAIDWAAQGLGLAWPQKPIAQLRVYLSELEDAFASLPWRSAAD